MNIQQLLSGIAAGDFKALARAVTWVENERPGYDTLLKSLPASAVPVVGFTGPPGAGKSTLINAIIGRMAKRQKKVAVVAVDPTSPFNYGSLLADRVRMAERFNDPSIFIRSIATRGSLGGLSDKIIEITDVLKAAPFDVVIVETVGVGQSEVEIAGLADCTVLVVVPEGGDEIQTMKSGIMEIADIFVVNKSDREGAGRMAALLEKMSAGHDGKKARPVLQTSASRDQGIESLMELMLDQPQQAGGEKHVQLLADKLYRMIRQNRMKDVSRKALEKTIRENLAGKGAVNIYAMAENYSKASR